MRFRAVVMVAIFWAGFLTDARADDVAAVMRGFGLFGTWSQDCSNQGMTDGLVLVRFTVSSLGTPRVVIGYPDEIDTISTIRAASRLAPDEVSLVLDPGLGQTAQTVILKLDDGALAIGREMPVAAGLAPADRGAAADGESGWPILHRCVSE